MAFRLNWRVLAVAVAAGCSFHSLPQPALADPALDPDADKILHSMSDYLASWQGFTFDFDASTELVRKTGQKLQLNQSGTVAVLRPGHVHATRKRADEEAEIFFDGKTITFYGKAVNAYAQIERPGTLDEAIDTARDEVGLDAPGADLLYTDVYSGLLLEAESGDYWGTTMVGGIKSHHVSVRAGQVDWQIWIQDGDKPLPLKYVITSKWMTGAPQYTLEIHNWNVEPKLDAKALEFVPPKDADKIEMVETNDLGEVELGENK